MNIINKIEYIKEHDVEIIFGYYMYSSPESQLLETDVEILNRTEELIKKARKLNKKYRKFVFTIPVSQLEIISYKTLDKIISIAKSIIIPDYKDNEE